MKGANYPLYKIWLKEVVGDPISIVNVILSMISELVGLAGFYLGASAFSSFKCSILNKESLHFFLKMAYETKQSFTLTLQNKQKKPINQSTKKYG